MVVDGGAPLYRISLRSVEPSLSYGDLMVLPNGGRPPSWICNKQWYQQLLLMNPIDALQDDKQRYMLNVINLRPN